MSPRQGLSGVPAFYSREGLNVATYDARLRPEGTPIDGDAAFYLAQARAARGPVLEVGTGTGRIAWELAAAGVAVVGLERSRAMLRRARAKAALHTDDAQRRVRFVRADVRTVDLRARFALVLVPFRAFQMLLTPRDQRRALARLRAHLRPGGRLVLDVFDPRLDRCHPAGGRGGRTGRARRAAAEFERETFVDATTGRTLEVRIVWSESDPLTQVLTQVWRFTERVAGRRLRREDELLRLRWTHRQEMRWLLELEGFEVEAEFSDFHGSPPAYGREQVWLARRTPRREPGGGSG